MHNDIKMTMSIHTEASCLERQNMTIARNYDVYRRIKKTMHSDPELTPEAVREKMLAYHMELNNNRDKIEKSLAVFKKLKRRVEDLIENKQESVRVIRATWTIELMLSRELTKLGHRLLKHIQKEILLVESDLAGMVDKVVMPEFTE